MQILAGNVRDLGDGFSVARVLPQSGRRTVGPFVFFDYFGPAEFEPGKGLDVRPHPHIGLATITYLFEGGILHRDSQGAVQEISPGAVNWMVAGRGITHSERTGPKMRAKGHRLHGIQSWIGLMQRDEECEPSFEHVATDKLPTCERDGVALRIVAGEAFGMHAPVRTLSPIFYVDADFAPDSKLVLPADYSERAIFAVGGELTVNDVRFANGSMLILEQGEAAIVKAPSSARAMLLGGEPLDGLRHIWWNFVSSSKERIERAKEDWRGDPTGRVPGDDEFIPLPELPNI